MNSNGTTTNDEPTSEIKRAIVQQELARWVNTRYLEEIRCRVNMRLDNKEAAESNKAEMVKCEKAIDYYKAELKALNEPIETPTTAGKE